MFSFLGPKKRPKSDAFSLLPEKYKIIGKTFKKGGKGKRDWNIYDYAYRKQKKWYSKYCNAKYTLRAAFNCYTYLISISNVVIFPKILNISIRLISGWVYNGFLTVIGPKLKDFFLF